MHNGIKLPALVFLKRQKIGQGKIRVANLQATENDESGLSLNDGSILNFLEKSMSFIGPLTVKLIVSFGINIFYLI